MATPDYERTCFVIMPFGKKVVRQTRLVPFLPIVWTHRVNFDGVYQRIFEPAIGAVELPEGGKLISHRADQSFFAGIISPEMFRYLEYSRLVVADISAENANVFYELGVRHRAREAGTVIFRQTDATVPFDINQVRAFPYEYEPETKASQSRELLERVLRESLTELRLDSPVQLAIRRQQNDAEQGPELEEILRSAEIALRRQDRAAAIVRYQEAIASYRAGPLVRLRLALLLRDDGRWLTALDELRHVTELMPRYAEGHRERGIVENKLYWSLRGEGRAADVTSGEESLRIALELSPSDYDALAALGGILKRANRLDEAYEMYRRATNVSLGHPYPLLNEIRVNAQRIGRLAFTEREQAYLKQARRLRAAQAGDYPPSDAPWCLFDLAEIALYEGETDRFLDTLKRGIESSTARWQITTFRESIASLASLEDVGPVDRDSLGAGVQALLDAEQGYDSPAG